MVDFRPIDGGATSSGHRLGATIVAVVLTCLALVCMPFGRLALAAHPGFLPAAGAYAFLIESMTAGLLVVQARLTRRRSALWLGTAYAFSALVTVPYLMAFPGVFAASAVLGGNETAEWLWWASHAGFAVCVIRFALGGDDALHPRDMVRAAGWTGLVVVCLTLLATAGLPRLPALMEGGRYSAFTAIALGPMVLALTGFAAWLVVSRLRCRTVMGLWLSVALLAASLDVALTLLGGGRFSVAWYAARAQSLMTGVCVLFALLSDLIRESRRIAEVNTQLERMVRTDVLTGLSNRRAFELALSAEWRRAQREQTPLSLLMIDIDCFKGFNDRYGHPAGDACLRAVGRVLSGQAYRPADIAARVGGEEFALILPVTEENGAVQVAERLRASIAGLLVPHAGSTTGFVTVSVGTATVRPYGPAMDMSQIVDDADHALYQAKASGRNTVWSSEPASLAPATL